MFERLPAPHSISFLLIQPSCSAGEAEVHVDGHDQNHDRHWHSALEGPFAVLWEQGQ